ncbi:MAG: serine dehydratase beta chain, partial [Alphaproteobacteria bacterium]
MFLSVFDVFKIGVGPSSSHTMGPMVAGGEFLQRLREQGLAPAHLRASLHGSLAFTGKGHASDRAVILGLAGFLPHDYDHAAAEQALAVIAETKTISVDGLPPMTFDPEADLRFDYEQVLVGHANGMKFIALDEHGAELYREIYYSIGGGFVVTAAELEHVGEDDEAAIAVVPYPFRNAEEMLEMAKASSQSIAEMKRANELTCCASSAEFDTGLDRIWSVMKGCMQRGLDEAGSLPGGLNVKRRAHDIHRQLVEELGQNDPAPHIINDWISVYAMAVNEENAAGGQVVT